MSRTSTRHHYPTCSGSRARGGRVVTDRTSSLSAPETFLLVAACVIAVAGCVTWCGAAVAALVNGGRLHGGLTAAIHATARLPQNMLDPRMAWRSPSNRLVLPGPGVYWLCTGLVLLALLAF